VVVVNMYNRRCRSDSWSEDDDGGVMKETTTADRRRSLLQSFVVENRLAGRYLWADRRDHDKLQKLELFSTEINYNSY